VAEEAGVQRSIIRHYIGNRDDLVTAAVARIIADYRAELASAIESLPQAELIPALLDYLFIADSQSELGEYDTLINALWASHERDPQTRAALLSLHLEFERLIDDALTHAFPNAEPEARRGTAYAIMCLANDTWSMVSLGFPQTRFATARHSAEQLILALSMQPGAAQASTE
jgi:AcrR family transcriptional regulator